MRLGAGVMGCTAAQAAPTRCLLPSAFCRLAKAPPLSAARVSASRWVLPCSRGERSAIAPSLPDIRSGPGYIDRNACVLSSPDSCTRAGYEEYRVWAGAWEAGRDGGEC